MVNIELFNFINGFVGRVPFLDNSMIFSAKYLIILIPLFLIYLFIKNKKKSLFVFSALLISFILSRLIGIFFYTPRPFAIGIGTQLVQHVADASFPSDHATTFFAFSFALLFLKYQKAGIIFLIFGALVGFARVFTGVHFPLDILGGFIVGLIGTGLFYVFLRKYSNFFRKKKR